MRVLVIEDNLDFAAFVIAVLEMNGFQVWRAPRLAVGVGLLQMDPFDLVLLDLSLPDGDGLEFFERPEAQHTRVIVMTSMTDDSVIARLQAVATAYFIKPISARALTDLVHQVLTEH